MPATPVERIVFFDGVCNLCNGFVQFVIARDPTATFRFATLQSEAAQHRLGTTIVPGIAPDTVLLWDHGTLYERSTAVLRIVRHLRAPWPLFAILIITPRPIRDWVYDRIAGSRYRWFGTRDVCMVPTPDNARRFL
jgi:predicted DCC family thiol-disulfide oxidoreductase YuxK